MNELIEQIKAWGIAKGITGPNGKGTLLGQLSKTQEELTETRDAAVILKALRCIDDDAAIFGDMKFNAMHELKDGIGDVFVTIVLASEMAGLDFQECVQAAYDEIKGRTGTMIDGKFVKDGGKS